MNIHLTLPKKKELVLTGNDDPLPYYYMPVFGKVYRLRLKKIMEMVSDNDYNRCLDIGFGSGILFNELSKKVKMIFGIEVHDKIAEVKRSPALNKINLRLIKSSIFNICFKDDSFDLLLCTSVLEHISALDDAFDEIKRVLMPAGKAVISIPHVSGLMSFIFRVFLRLEDINSRHISDHKVITEALHQGFKIIDTKEIRPIPLLPPVYYCFLVQKRQQAS